ncbi:uncharacterized protein ANIA_06469 [Aspergillus nidulans FGSC A4]|uniref:NWD NACHT-NTPase N-terminal domain-containing protein n=1 Tax=Emericella nidulans (strain FGSC A4 / ATCC 38163 / CBS 112.46 / NRRL 194 / M139) TaxID=227321 RepID=C8V061_EMENI|nr:hypothetical protein [Aspergillus nidulans FGSC A4]CBF69403.1 TPA: conserved hypothetical protein [Aspergillus nidulans FGSC A4]
MDISSIEPRSAPPTKPDLWQRAFDDLRPEDQELIKSVSMPSCNKKIECNGENNSSAIVSRLRILSELVESVKIQYQTDQENSRIKEPAQRIVKAVPNFQSFIQKAVAIDPTGHATSVWAIVSLGFTKEAWLESCASLTNVITRYSLVEDEYRKNPTTDEHVETALVQVYAAVLTFAARAQSLYDRGRAVWIWKSVTSYARSLDLSIARIKTSRSTMNQLPIESLLVTKSIPGDSLTELRKSIAEAEFHLQKWFQIVDCYEQRERVNRLLEVADNMLSSANEPHDKIDLAELKVAEEAHYNAYTGEEDQERLPETRTELLEDIKSWATDPDRRPVFWLQEITTSSAANQEAIRTSRDNGSRNPQEQFNELLFEPLKSLNLGLRTPLILAAVIDALDECQVPGDVTAFLSILPTLNDLEEVHLRVLITRRPEPPVTRGFRSIYKDEIILHQIKRSTIQHDISVFL